ARVGLAESPDLTWQREDDVEVAHRQESFRTRRDPPLLPQRLTLGAVPVAAGVVRGMLESARGTRIDMAAERGCPAQRDGREHPALRKRQVVLGLERRAVLPNDLGDVETWPPAGCPAGIHGGSVRLQSIEGTLGLGYQGRGDTRIARGGFDAAVAEQYLDHAQIGAAFQEVCREAVPKHVRRDLPCHAGLADRELERQARRVRTQVATARVRLKDPRRRRSLDRPVLPQDHQQARAEHHEALLLALATPNVN